MTVRELAEKLELNVVAGTLDAEITGVYAGDLLSNVMARAGENNLWVTVQGHQNVVAVAALANLSAVVVVENFPIEEDAVKRATEKGVNLLRTSMTAYDLICKLAALGI